MRGDVLAQGARRATFGPVKAVSQAKWDSIFGIDEPKEKSEIEVEKEPINGERI